MKILVTGAAGFIGYHTAARLLGEGHHVTGLDDCNDYYDPRLKRDRLARLEEDTRFSFHLLDVADRSAVERVFATSGFDRVVHLAAQVGVRHCTERPHAYVDSNLVGFANVLEGCRRSQVEHLVYASSSSVYGLNEAMPFAVEDPVDHPISLYAATKKANELMAHVYSHLHGLPTTGLRFFTVYGPWGRPDMALFLFTRKILAGEPIQVFDHGKMRRDFTYVDDVVEGVVRALDRVPTADPSWTAEAPTPASSSAPFRIYNIGNHTPVELEEFIACIEGALGTKAVKEYMPRQPGDVPATAADVESLSRDVGFAPATPLEEGVRLFVAWYRDYYDR